MTAAATLGARESVGGNTALEILAEFFLDEARKGRAIGVAALLEKTGKVVANEREEWRLFWPVLFILGAFALGQSPQRAKSGPIRFQPIVGASGLPMGGASSSRFLTG
jgi:hypothetical protein